MISMEDWVNIRAQIKKGVYHKGIAHELGINSRALKRNRAPKNRSIINLTNKY